MIPLFEDARCSPFAIVPQLQLVGKCIARVKTRICNSRHYGRSCLRRWAFVSILRVYPTETQFQPSNRHFYLSFERRKVTLRALCFLGFDRQSSSSIITAEGRMARPSFTNEQLNYFKFATIVLNEFSKAIRSSFRTMWDNTYGRRLGYQPWDDSIVVRSMFLATEGGKTNVPTNLSYEEWDCTALFQATIYAQSFAPPYSTGYCRTLSDLYVKPRRPVPGNFHASVVSPSGNKAETFALAIDQLRLLRNSLCHSPSSEIVKATFDQYVQLSKDAFRALGISEDPIDAIGGLTDSDFPTEEVHRLEQAMKQETRAYIKFLEAMSSDIDEIKGNVENTAKKEDIARLERKINDLREDKPGNTFYLIFVE